MSDYDDTEDLTDDECRQLLRVIAHERDCLRAALVRAHDGDAIAAARAERAITAPPWRYKEWGGLVVGGGEGSAEVLICTMATNTRHDEGRHNRELIIDAPTLRARLDKAEAELAAARAERDALNDRYARLAGDYSEEASYLRARAEKAEAEAARLLADALIDIKRAFRLGQGFWHKPGITRQLFDEMCARYAAQEGGR